MFTLRKIKELLSKRPKISRDTAILTSKRVSEVLRREKAKVAIVARVGIPEKKLPEDIKYTHVAFWIWKEKDNKYFVQDYIISEEDKLKSCIKKTKECEFFLDAYSSRAGIIIPKDILQEKLLSLFSTEKYLSLHNENYSLVAKPDSKKYQNCTGFLLKVIISCIYETDNIDDIDSIIRRDFHPTIINMGTVKKLVLYLTRSDFHYHEHQEAIMTTTFTSVSTYMDSNLLSVSEYHI